MEGGIEFADEFRAQIELRRVGHGHVVDEASAFGIDVVFFGDAVAIGLIDGEYPAFWVDVFGGVAGIGDVRPEFFEVARARKDSTDSDDRDRRCIASHNAALPAHGFVRKFVALEGVV